MGSSVGFVSSGVWALAGKWFLVDQTPCIWVRMCPFWVSSDSEKNFLTFFTFTRGHDRYLPFRMALSQVALVGKPEAPWRYLLAGSMIGNYYTLLISSEGDGLYFLKNSMCLSMRAQEGTSYRGFN